MSYTSPLKSRPDAQPTLNGTRNQAATGLCLEVSWASLSASPLLPQPQRTRGGVWEEAGAGAAVVSLHTGSVSQAGESGGDGGRQWEPSTTTTRNAPELTTHLKMN